jgi:hypothetical protein
MPKQAKKVIILGSGPSLGQYKNQETDVIWCPLSLRHESIENGVQYYFGIHDSERESSDKKVITQDTYPLEEIIDIFESRYFTNTISYIIAYALLTGVEEIEIYGVDMNGKDEYINQRGSVMYWIGRAESVGVKVTMGNEMNNPIFLYGFDDAQKERLFKKMLIISEWAGRERANTDNQREQDQFTGILIALDMINKEL